jgi:phenylalanine ammonia-lyase
VSSSLALISGRATINSLDVLTILTATYLYVLCQTLDIRALQSELYEGVNTIITEELSATFATFLDDASFQTVTFKVKKTMREALDAMTTMEAVDRMITVAVSSTTCLIDFFTGHDIVETTSMGVALTCIPAFRTHVASRANNVLLQHRCTFSVYAPSPPYENYVKIKLFGN